MNILKTFNIVYKYSLAGDLATELRRPFIIWGIFALLGVELLYLLSLGFFRHKAYRLFFVAHGIGFLLLMLGVCAILGIVVDGIND